MLGKPSGKEFSYFNFSIRLNYFDNSLLKQALLVGKMKLNIKNEKSDQIFHSCLLGCKNFLPKNRFLKGAEDNLFSWRVDGGF